MDELTRFLKWRRTLPLMEPAEPSMILTFSWQEYVKRLEYEHTLALNAMNARRNVDPWR